MDIWGKEECYNNTVCTKSIRQKHIGGKKGAKDECDGGKEGEKDRE